ncbi:NAD-P-binding protein [Trametes polyzona]|nr:NAD-P-binding protein [Trametes polyzona]
MPTVTSGRVLVTGANGYVAVWVLKYLLERSFEVRGTVRSESKGTYLRDLFEAYGDNLELVVVDDITKEGAFDAAVEGVDAILHVAAPVNLHAVDPDEVIVPGVNGAVNILKSAVKHRATVKRVVFTSSCAAIVTPPESLDAKPRVFDENDWNDAAVKEVQEKGRDAFPLNKYRASKVLAERAAWEFYEKEKARMGAEGLGWDFVVLAPPYIFGPVLHEVPSFDAFSGTARLWYNRVVKGIETGHGAWMNNGYEYVDVRDFAHAEVLALISPDVGGERIITCGQRFTWQGFVNIASRYSDKIPGTDPSHDPSKLTPLASYNSEKSRRLLGIQYRSLEETTKDTLEDLKSRGWL